MIDSHTPTPLEAHTPSSIHVSHVSMGASLPLEEEGTTRDVCLSDTNSFSSASSHFTVIPSRHDCYTSWTSF